MKLLQKLIAKRFYVYALGLLITAAVIMGNGVTSAQGTDSIYLTPATGSYAVGASFTVTIRENSGSPVNAVQADLTYPTNLLQFVSIDGSGSAFGVDASSTGGSGSVSISRGSTSSVTGDQLVSKVSFKVLAAGTAPVAMASSSVVLSSSTNGNVVGTRNGGLYTLTGPASPTPPPTTPPATPTPTPVAPTQPPATPPASGGNGTTTRSATSGSTVSIAPKGNPSQANLPGDSVVELTTPATLQTNPAAGKDVSKVEYRVNGKLVATLTTPPYNYTVDTSHYRNGTYTVTTKTIYKDGKSDIQNASLVVKNPFGMTQALLQLRHYAWLVILVLLVAAELVYLRFFRHRMPRSPYDHHGDDVLAGFGGSKPGGPSGVAAPQATFGPPTSITPTSGTTTVKPTVPPSATPPHVG